MLEKIGRWGVAVTKIHPQTLWEICAAVPVYWGLPDGSFKRLWILCESPRFNPHGENMLDIAG